MLASLVAQLVKSLLANAGNARDRSSMPGLAISPEEGNGNLLQYSCLKNSMDRGPCPQGPKIVEYDLMTNHYHHKAPLKGLGKNLFLPPS